MNLYITLGQKSIFEEELDKLDQIITKEQYRMLGNYESRGYLTMVIEVAEYYSEEVIKQIEERIHEQMNVVEINKSMKFYYIINPGCISAEINSKARRLLEAQNYQIKICNSYSENGYLYVCVRIKDVNPRDKKGIHAILKLLTKIDGIKDVAIY